MGLLRRAERAETIWALADRVLSFVPASLVGTVTYYVAQTHQWIIAQGPLGWWGAALVGVFFTSLAVAASGWGVRQWQQWRASRATGNLLNLKPLFEAFEQHAVEENELSRSCGPANKNAGILLADDDRIRLRGLLEKTKKAANGLRLMATERAIDSGLRAFSNRLDRGTAYAKYNGVREVLFDELEGSKHVVLTS